MIWSVLAWVGYLAEPAVRRAARQNRTRKRSQVGALRARGW